MNKETVIKTMCDSGVLPVFRTDDVTHLIPAAKAFHDAGIGCVEYTMTMPNALELIKESAATFPEDLLIGIGTVLDGNTVEQAAEAGATFVACPGHNRDIIEACNHTGMVSVMGAITPTEIMQARSLGADIIKVFPADSVGPRFFTSIHGPFPDLHLMAAGGMTLSSLGDYVSAGAEVVTLLGNGLDPTAYATGDCPAITRAATKWVDAVRTARKKVHAK
ncbi:bifunctional 4-hydroxy-2-oxoglutarate aldolase/2-dehydro-3-deoxy-phosphogluconate aldolase [Verrucomicrobiota bacterium]